MKRHFKIAIIDYKMSNIFSIKNALDYLGYENEVTSDYKIIASADGAVLPGVGSFPDAMKHIKKLDLHHAIDEFVLSGKPFMGICLGLQLLFSESEEFGHTEGLGVIEGSVNHFSKHSSIKRVPHVGWNKVLLKRSDNNSYKRNEELLHLFGDNDYFFFVHSCYVKPNKFKDILTETQYDKHIFCSSILRENIFATQFHPEKSGPRGLKIFIKFFK